MRISAKASRSDAEVNLDVTDPANPAKTQLFTTPVEVERLGGIERSVVVHVKSMNRWQWHLVVFLSVGLFHWVMRTPEKLSLMILGKSGRVLILSRKPMTPLRGAFIIFTAFGIGLMTVFSILLVWFRSIERSLIQAEKSGDPAVRRQAESEASIFKGCVGQVHVYGLVTFGILWIIEAIVLVVSLRPWAGEDHRDYYEAEEASCAQYFRGGERPLIPFICPRRREGALRMFFGPYPDGSLWHRMGRRFKGLFLTNLEPLLFVPGGDAGPAPSTGLGDVSAEDQANNMQIALGAFNWLLGLVGTFCFVIHIFNLVQNIEMCPFEKVVAPCVRENDCTMYGQAGWFQIYAERAGLASRQEIAERAMGGYLSRDDIGVWITRHSQSSSNATNSSVSAEPTTQNDENIMLSVQNATVEEAIVLIAQKSCLDRRQELIDGPQSEARAKKADTLGKFNSHNYNTFRIALGIDIWWDMQALDCKECQRATVLHYFTNFENTLEVLEILILGLTCYISNALVKIARNRMNNAPVGDVAFESDPSSAADVPVEAIERACTNIMRDIFFFRYRGGRLPKQVQRLEAKIKFATSQGMNSAKQQDPWEFDDRAYDWTNYALQKTTANAKTFMVSRRMLGILDGERVITAWSETPRLTIFQIIIIVGGTIFCLFAPLAWAINVGKSMCFIESGVGTVVFMFLIFLWIRGRVQAGFVLTSRRLYQISRKPAIRDLFGLTEPLLKIDILAHNAGIYFIQGTFEAKMPLWRQFAMKICRMQRMRKGSLTVAGDTGVFRLWRDVGDARETIEAFSKASVAERVKGIDPKMGFQMRMVEKTSGVEKPKDPCPSCICLCCPSTPPLTYADPDLIRRYVMRFNNEENVYGRLLTTRAAGPKDLFCGKGCCRCACECCPCCLLDETLCDFEITTHRILVEQRVNMRYCGFFGLCRMVPNIRVSFVSTFKASSYVLEKGGSPYGCCSLRQDMTAKVLPDDFRHFPNGLFMKQQPFRIVSMGQTETHGKEGLWVKHLSQLLDKITEKKQNKDLDNPTSDEECSDYDYDFDAGDDDKGGKGKGKGKRRKGKGKGKKGKGKGKGKGTGEDDMGEEEEPPVCNNCGEFLPEVEEAVFCAFCGARIEAPVREEREEVEEPEVDREQTWWEWAEEVVDDVAAGAATVASAARGDAPPPPSRRRAGDAQGDAPPRSGSS